MAAVDGLYPAGEGLIVMASVQRRPVEVLSCQHVTSKLAVVGDPVRPFIVMGRLHNRGLVCPQLWSLLWEPGTE